MCTFAERLNKLRKERNLTQKELAENTDISVRTIKRYEAGDSLPAVSDTRTNSALDRLAEFFGVYPIWLLTGKGYESAWKELQESANSSITHKWVVDARIKAHNELKACIIKNYQLDDYLVNPFAGNESMTHEQRAKAERVSQLTEAMLNNIFNHIEMSVKSYRLKISDLI